MADKVERQKSLEIEKFEILPWNENFNTGHELIDEQHRTLVKLLNELARTLVEQNYSVVNSSFDELAAYANVHFADEEAVWLKYYGDDSWFSSHQRKHAAFMPKVNELKEKSADKPLPAIVEDIMKFLVHWLAFHIIYDDKRMAVAIDAMKAGASIEEAKIIADKEMSGSLQVLIDTILNMYNSLSTRTLDLFRERNARIIAEEKLKEANRKLAKLSNTDQLTGLYNRRFLDMVFENELRRAIRDTSLLTFYMIDVDYFKYYNDNYGHLAGDFILKQVADSLKQVCRRPNDYVFRIGGEEFGILTTFRAENEASEFGGIIRKSIEDLKIPHEHSNVNKYVTVSIGGRCYTPLSRCRFKEYMEIADKRLYKAKAAGRNRTVMSD